MSLRGNGRRSTCLGDPKFTTDNLGLRTRTMNEQQQEQPKEPTLAELAGRVARVEEYIKTQSSPTFDDIYRMLAAILQRALAFETEAINKSTQVHAEHNAYHQEVKNMLIDRFRAMEAKIDQDIEDIRRRFNERVGQEIVRVTSDTIADSLSRRVLTVRTAARGTSTWSSDRRLRQRFERANFFEGRGNHRQGESQNGRYIVDLLTVSQGVSRSYNHPEKEWTVLTCSPNGGIPVSHQPDHIALPHPRTTRRRRNGCGLQG